MIIGKIANRIQQYRRTVSVIAIFTINSRTLKDIELEPNIHWTSNYGTGIVFIGNMLSWLSFHNFV